MELDSKAQKAREKGNKKIPEFQQFFPQGANHIVYDVSAWQYISKCEVSDEEIPYLAQNIHKPIYALFAEINSEIDPDYIFVYYDKKKLFFFAPLTLSQKNVLNTITDFNKAWLYTAKGQFNPKKAIFNPLGFVIDKKFQNGVKKFSQLYQKIKKIIKKQPETFPDAIKPELEKIDKQFQKTHGNIHLLDKFDSLYEKVVSLNSALNESLGQAINRMKFGASAGDKAKGALIGAPAIDLKVNPIYIIPKIKSIIPVVLIPNQGFSFRLFEHYQSFYSFLKTLSSSFKS